MKKVHLRALAALAVMSLVILHAGASTYNYSFMVNGIAYKINDDNTTVRVYPITDDENNYSGLTAANIPASVTYNSKSYPVKEIAAGAFRKSPIKTASIPASVVNIYDEGFSRCANLTTVTMGNAVTYIGKMCFYECQALAKVTLSNKLTTIDNYAFQGCAALKTITLPGTLTTLGMAAFQNCTSLTSITIPSAVEKLQESWFANCTALKSVTWNPTACANAPDPALINVPPAPFVGCTALSTFTFGSNVTRIPDYLCWELPALTSITIPASVSYVGRSAFSNCTGLKTLNWNAKETNDFNYSSGLMCPFYKCTSLQTVKIGNTVERIPASLLRDRPSVTTVSSLPASVRSIGSYAFRGTRIKEYTVPSTVTSVEEGAFVLCDSLKRFTWDVVEHSNYQNNYTPFIVNGTQLGHHLEHVTLGSHVKKVPAYLFYSMGGDMPQDELVLPEGLTEVGAYSFYNVKATSLTLPSTLTTVNPYAFRSARATSLTLPQGLTYVGEQAFAACPLTALYLPASVGYVGVHAFSAANLQSVTVDPNNTTYDSRDGCNAIIGTASNTLILGSNAATIPPTVTTIGNYAFYGCTFTSIDIPASVTSIGAYAFGNSGLTSFPSSASVTAIGGCAFRACKKLKNVSLPGSVKTIGARAFYDCTNLNTLILPSSITSIGESTFVGCYYLNAIKSFIAHPDSVSYGNYMFSSVPVGGCRLLVPVGTMETYQSTSPWKNFAIKEFVPGDINADGVVNGADVTALYNALLKDEYQYVIDGDVNNDSFLNGADVTALYDILFTTR